MHSRLAITLLLAALAGGAAHADGGPALPWADPIGVSPTFGTATPSAPYAEPIGTSQLNRPRQSVTVLPRPLRQVPAPSRSCYRFRDDRGAIGTRCRTLR